MRKKHSKPNGYPLPDRTVLYTHRKNLKPVPVAGRKYHCFDDGKITFSRHFIVEVTEVLNYMEFRRKYPEYFQKYMDTAKDDYWLYSRRSDKFIICEHGENDEFGVYVRTKNGGWFGIGDWNNSATLDVTGEIWKNLIENIDMFDYSKTEKEKIIRDNTI